MNIALVDTTLTGHHLMYLQFFAQILLSKGHQVHVFVPDSEEVKMFFEKESIGTVHYHHLPLNTQQKNIQYRIHSWYVLHKALKSKKINLVAFLYLDNWIYDFSTEPYGFSIFGKKLIIPGIARVLNATIKNSSTFMFPHKWIGILFNPHKINKYQTELLNADNCQGIAVLDEVWDKYPKSFPLHKTYLFPDFTNDIQADKSFEVAKQIIEKAKGRTIVTLAGSLEKRKGLLDLLKIAQTLKQEPFYFVTAGGLAADSFSKKELAEVNRAIKNSADNLHIHPYRIREEACFNAIIEYSDILYLAYKNFNQSSNLLTKAVVYQKPVLVNKGFCMAHRVEEYHLGLTVPQSDLTLHVEALHKLANDYQSFKSRMDSKRFLNQHSVARLHACLDEVLHKAIHE